MDSRPGDEEIDRLRRELAEWRRRAEVAEAVAGERLARAETAELALEAARAALGSVAGPAGAPAGPAPEGDAAADPAPEPPRSLRERWRRYVETIN